MNKIKLIMLFGVLNANAIDPKLLKSPKPESASVSRDGSNENEKDVSKEQCCCLVSFSPCICILASFCTLIHCCQAKFQFGKGAGDFKKD